MTVIHLCTISLFSSNYITERGHNVGSVQGHRAHFFTALQCCYQGSPAKCWMSSYKTSAKHPNKLPWRSRPLITFGLAGRTNSTRRRGEFISSILQLRESMYAVLRSWLPTIERKWLLKDGYRGIGKIRGSFRRRMLPPIPSVSSDGPWILY